ncbi:MAG: peptide chain release factor N(5)-glutamine methyltransferase [Rhodospirillaceae bacterium]|nr:peptide chain release factor N(5)-glutamine methyltransferase [Rhodospirillaceae bacterium]MBT5665455.1 peptide chain release factor N(5)-glutamine methyltransferase [Rhodospirillaceae bacterium]MBT5811600.1 peptide chain release factor N(5)-glutamine methyltransferase [Rhodospirillaceae bacterium]
MSTIKSNLDDGARILNSAGVESPRQEARLLLAHASGLSVATLMGYPERVVENDSLFRQLVSRRAAREPLSHLVGRREFWSLPFKVTADTLDPRPDSETIVEAALDCVSDRSAPLRILDLGTGTGCLLLALLSELPTASGVGVDRSVAAARVAAENAAALGLGGRAAFVVGDWGQAVTGGFDLIVSNPPYIPRDHIDGLELEVSRYEPHLALAGGEDGLSAYRAILPDVPGFLSPGGVAVLEIGADQADSVTALAQKVGLLVSPVRSDLASRDRCLVCRKG